MNQSKAKQLINEVFAKCIDIDIKALHSVKTIDLICGYSLLSYLIEMYLKDRGDIESTLGTHANNYNIVSWFNDNLYCKYLIQTIPYYANKIKNAMVSLSKHILNPLRFIKIQSIIYDSFNDIMKYIIIIYQFIQSVIDVELDQIFPLHFDFLIIPRQINNATISVSLQELLSYSTYEEDIDYYVEDIYMDTTQQLLMQFRRIWIEKAEGDKYSHQRYIWVISRNHKGNDQIYLFILKDKKYGEIFDKYYLIPESLLIYSQQMSILDPIKQYTLHLSFHLFEKTNCKCYGYILNNGIFKFELDSIQSLLPKYFNKHNNQLQHLNSENKSFLNKINPLPNKKFNEFFRQAHDPNNFNIKLQLINNDNNILPFRLKREIMQVIVERCNPQVRYKIFNVFTNLIGNETHYDIKSINNNIDKILNKFFDTIDNIWNNIDIIKKKEDFNYMRIELKKIIIHNGHTFNITQFKLDKIYYQTHIPRAKELQIILQSKWKNKYKYDHSMTITKAMELCNNRPIMLWLLNYYSLQRADLFKQNKLTKSKHYAYDPQKWMEENNYCKWLKNSFPNEWEHIQTSFMTRIKRMFPKLNYTPSIDNKKINDSCTDIAIYILALHYLIYQINELYHCAPVQIDIIFMCERTVIQSNNMNTKPIVTTADDATFPLGKNKYYENDSKISHNRLYNKSNFIDEILQDMCINKDYFESNQKKDELNLVQLIKKFLEIWRTFGNIDKRRKKYLFVIDRRKKDDCIYFIIPPKLESLPLEIYELQELFLTSSAKYLQQNGQSTFGLSYHLLQSNNIDAYLYLNNGIKTFQLNDIETVFPIFFTETVNGIPNQLTVDIKREIKNYEIKKKLVNVEFEDFVRQCDNFELNIGNDNNDIYERKFESKLEDIDENNVDNSEELYDEELIYKLREIFNNNIQKDMIVNKIWSIIEREISEQELNINDIKQQMKQIEKSKLLKTIITSIPEYKDEIILAFIMRFGDNTLLGQEILKNDSEKRGKEIIEIRKKAIYIKRCNKKYVELKTKKCELTNDELIAIIYFTKYMNVNECLNFKTSLNWKYLFYFIRNGVSKLFKAFHYKNKQQREYKTLYNGNLFTTLTQLSNRQIPLIFNREKDNAIKFGGKMMIIIKDSKIGLMSGQLFGANISWINNRDDEFIILPHSYRDNNFHKMNKEFVIKNNLPSNINIYISKKYKIIPFNNNNNIHAKIICNTRYNELDQIRNEIIRIFTIQFDKKFAQILLLSFNKVIEEEQFDEIDTIRDDLNDSESSAIFDYIWKNICNIIGNDIDKKKKIICGLQNILNGKARLFAIKDFTFTVKQKDVIIATNDVNIHCSMIYNQYNNINSNVNGQRANIAEDKSLCIAKAVDDKNGYTILKWLLDSFSRDRIIGHKYLYKKQQLDNNITFDKYRYDKDKYCIGYNPTTWWLHDSAFCKYIQYKNAKMALPMMTAVQALSKRVLPQINFNSQLTHVIHDNLNIFIKYTFITYNFIFNLITKNNNKNILPCQFDFIIIPQCTKPGKINPIFDLQELFQNDNNENNINNTINVNGIDLNTQQNNLDFFYENNDNKFNKMCNDKIEIWQLENYLINNGGYIKNKNFWVENVVQEEEKKFEQQIIKMWKKANGHINTHRRFIFCIDRRCPLNLQEKNMGFDKPKYFKTSKDWPDKIYLIIPKNPKNGIISKQVIRIPEVCLGYSQEYILPNIGINQPLNGYKFALCYHVLQNNSVSVYSYINQGAEKFELDDMEWFWTRFFCKINGNEQVMNDENIDILNKMLKDKRLPDDKFFEFWKQCHAMRIVHER